MTSITFDQEEFLKERRHALLSMDKTTIESYLHKYGVRIPSNEDTFWISIHMARTGAKDLPMEQRIISKQWLRERGYRSMDDGEVPTTDR